MKDQKLRMGLLLGGLVVAVMVMGCPPGTEDIIKEVFKPPTVMVRNVTIKEFSPQGVTLMMDVDITNPNPIGAAVPRLDYALELSGSQLVQGTIDTGIELKANGTSNAQVPVPLKYQDVVSVFTATLGRDTVPYKISGNIYVQSPIGNIPIPYSHEDEFPLQY